LVYTLSPMTRNITGAGESEIDLNDADVQRHFLEVANLRMLFLVDEKEGKITNFTWKTCEDNGLNAKVSFVRNGVSHKVGIINHPTADAESLLTKLETALADEAVEMVWVVSRDEAHQQALQKCVAAHMGTGSAITRRIAFATHQEIYKAGIVKSKWQSAEMRQSAIFIDSIADTKSCSFNLRPQIATA